MNHKIIVFSTPTCSWCKKLKDYLRQNGFTYRDVDVSKDDTGLRDMIRKTGQQGVPQLWIDNQPVVGFDRSKIDRLLDITKAKKGVTNG
ncbi:MAG: glutaredoxin domain-containing protein [Candidatus Cloacimonadota bacterium]